MGPPIFIGGNTPSVIQNSFSSPLLQWGRRFSSAEMPELRVLAAPVVLASMGPPIFIGGNPDWFAH